MQSTRSCARCSAVFDVPRKKQAQDKRFCTRTCATIARNEAGSKYEDVNDQRRCRKCLVLKPRAESFKRSRKSGGFASACKDCELAYRKANAGLIRANNALHYERIKASPERLTAERERKRIAASASYWKNHEEKREQARIRAQQPKEKVRRKAYVLANLALYAKLRCAAYQRDPERYKTIGAKWRAKNPHAVRASAAKGRLCRSQAVIQDISGDLLRQRASVFGDACAYCGGDNEHWDHAIPISRGGKHCLANLRPSCSACNLSKSTKTIREWLTMSYGRGWDLSHGDSPHRPGLRY